MPTITIKVELARELLDYLLDDERFTRIAEALDEAQGEVFGEDAGTKSMLEIEIYQP